MNRSVKEESISDDNNGGKSGDSQNEKIGIGCLTLVAITIALIAFVSLREDSCDSECEHKQNACALSSASLREINDFHRERLIISAQEHSRREREILYALRACMDDAESLSEARSLSEKR